MSLCKVYIIWEYGYLLLNTLTGRDSTAAKYLGLHASTESRLVNAGILRASDIDELLRKFVVSRES